MDDGEYGRKKDDSQRIVLKTALEYMIVLIIVVFVGSYTLHQISGPLTSVFSQLNSGFQQH